METAPPPCSVDTAIEWLRKAFRGEAAAAAGVRVVYQVDLSGERGGAFWIRVEEDRLEIAEGRAPAPDVTFRMAAGDFFGVLAGRENPDLLFLADRLAIDGDLSTALGLRKLFQSRL